MRLIRLLKKDPLACLPGLKLVAEMSKSSLSQPNILSSDRFEQRELADIPETHTMRNIPTISIGSLAVCSQDASKVPEKILSRLIVGV